jgi:hypothetical protein
MFPPTPSLYRRRYMRPTRLAFPLAAIFAATLAAGGCQRNGLNMQDIPVEAETTLQASGCSAEAATSWTPRPDFGLSALVTGPDCAKSVVLLTVRDANENVLLAWAAPVKDVFGLKDATTRPEMETALSQFIAQRDTTTANLPEWTDPDGLPGGEFPFHPEAWIDRETYASMRAGAAPVLAFPQGHESQATYALRDGSLEFIGVQQFPG